MKLFLDSGAFIARALKDDRYHAAAIGVFEGISKARHPFRVFYTSNYVVDETITFLLYEAGGRVAVSVLGLIRSCASLRFLHVSDGVDGAPATAFRRHASS